MNEFLALYKDKVLHFVAGLVVGSLVLIAARYFGPPPVNALWAIAGAALAGVCKEAYDHLENLRDLGQGEPASHDVSVWDALATTGGGLAVAILYVITHR